MRRIHISPGSELKNSPILICGLLRLILVATFGSQTLILFIFPKVNPLSFFAQTQISPFSPSLAPSPGLSIKSEREFTHVCNSIPLLGNIYRYCPYPAFVLPMLCALERRSAHSALSALPCDTDRERIKNLTMSQKQAERIKNLTMSQKLTARHYYRKAHHCR